MPYFNGQCGSYFSRARASLFCTPVDVERGATRSVDDCEPFDTHVFRLEFDESASPERRLKTCGYRG